METVFERFIKKLEVSLGDSFEYVPEEEIKLMGICGADGYYSQKLSTICGHEAYLYEKGHAHDPYIHLMIVGYGFEDTYIINSMEARDIVELLRRNYI